MTDKRTISISVTINLGNYENIHLEVSDVAETKEEANELRRFLSSVLDDYGNNNATTKAAIEKYQERVLADAAYDECDESCLSEFSQNTFESKEDSTNGCNISCDAFNEDSSAVRDNNTEYGNAKDCDKKDCVDDDELVLFKDDEKLENDLVDAEDEAYDYADDASPEKSTAENQKGPVVNSEYVCSKCGAPITKLQREVSMLFNHKVLCESCMHKK